MKPEIIVVLSICYGLPIAWAGLPSAEELLANSIAYHDPQNRWHDLSAVLQIAESRPDGTVRRRTLRLHQPTGDFSYETKTGEHHIIAKISGTTTHATVNGQIGIAPDLIEKYRLEPDSIARMRNYYLYLYGLPMKLRDPGTRIEGPPFSTNFLSKQVLALKVTYDPGVGTDIWYFYFDPQTYALVGCRFYKTDAETGGEYILFQNETQAGTLRFPKVRKWYMNADSRFLGTDTLVEAHLR